MPEKKIETRRFRVIRQGMKPPSSRYSIIQCPFCNSQVQAFHWSLAGSGKKCGCGAKFNSWGDAVKERKA